MHPAHAGPGSVSRSIGEPTRWNQGSKTLARAGAPEERPLTAPRDDTLHERRSTDIRRETAASAGADRRTEVPMEEDRDTRWA